MNWRNAALVLCFSVLCKPVTAQVIDNTLSFKNINRNSYFRFNYENDVFQAIDEYYTQGVHLEVVKLALKKNPINKLLVHPDFSTIKYGLGIEHNGYTPASISDDTIRYGDRPFGAALELKSFQIAIDPINKQRFSSILTLGVLGPAAGAREMQIAIHKWLNNITPHGWQFQLHNDIILNYEVNYEKQLLSKGKWLSIDADAMARAGTLSDKAQVGATLMLGYFDSPFSDIVTGKNNFRIYAYQHSEVAVIAYDATLQGGMFNHTSPYTIFAKDVKRVTYRNRLGIVGTYKRITMEYFQSFITREFETGKPHAWGGIQFACAI